MDNDWFCNDFKKIHPGAECSEVEKEGGAEKKPPGFEIFLGQDAKSTQNISK